MGLGGGTVKVKYGKDPRNTAWSNDTSRFGHQHMEKMGWTPGSGLGVGSSGREAMTSHIKITVKTDNTGLGKKSQKKKGIAEMDGAITTGLDVFQKLLGKLNGKEQEVASAIQRERQRMVFDNPKFGMEFEYGGLLEGSITKEWLDKSQPQSEESTGKKEKSKKAKKDKKEKKSSKKRKHEHSDDDSDSDSSSSKKKKKKSKEEKGKKDKKEKKEKKSKRASSSEEESVPSSGETTPRPQPILRGRAATRMKFIAQKRASTADAKALNEILMIHG